MASTHMNPMEKKRRIKIESSSSKSRGMSCLFKLFKSKAKPNQPDLRIITTPLNLDEIPENPLYLRALEATLLDTLVSIHYQLEDTKAKIRASSTTRSIEETNQLLAKRYTLTEKKKLFLTRLEKVKLKIKEIQTN